MNKQTEKVRRYQSARVRLPNLALSMTDSANLYDCGSASNALRQALHEYATHIQRSIEK
jgi:hypothetical protein